MLCVSLFMAQLVFIIGVDKIENQVWINRNESIHIAVSLSLIIGWLFSCGCDITVSVPGHVHVDVNGGCGLICYSC